MFVFLSFFVWTRKIEQEVWLGAPIYFLEELKIKLSQSAWVYRCINSPKRGINEKKVSSILKLWWNEKKKSFGLHPRDHVQYTILVSIFSVLTLSWHNCTTLVSRYYLVSNIIIYTLCRNLAIFAMKKPLCSHIPVQNVNNYVWH